MERWTRFLALSAAVMLAAAPAWAQTSTTSPADKGTSGTSGSSGTTGSSTTGSTSSDTGTSSTTEKGTTAKTMGKHHRKGRMARGHSSEQVKAVQQALKDKGMDPGDVDGKMGPKTHAALREFQKKEGLKVTGRPDSETMSKLGVEQKTGSTGASSSPSASPSTSNATGSSTNGSSSMGSSSGTTGNTGTMGGSGTGGSSSTGGGSTTGGEQKK